jgi:flagellar motor switch protein FliN/FliY
MNDQNTNDVGEETMELQENRTSRPIQFPQLQEENIQKKTQNLDLILDVTVGVTVALGRKDMRIQEVLELTPGTLITLNKGAGDPVDILVNGFPVAKGEVLVIQGHFGVRITEILGTAARVQNLGVMKPTE